MPHVPIHRVLFAAALIALLALGALGGTTRGQQSPEKDPSGACASPVASPAASPAANPTVSPLSSPLASPAASPCASPTAGGAPIVVQVKEGDFMVATSETTFKVGQPYTFVTTNSGKAEHELVIEPKGVVDQPLKAGGQVAEAAEIAPGQSSR